MTACNHHRAAYSNSLTWIDWDGDIHLPVRFSAVLNINPASACVTVIVFYRSHRLLFPGAKSWYFFITRAGKQGPVTGSGTVFTEFCFFFFNLVQNKGVLVNSPSWELVQNSSLQRLWLPSSPPSDTTDSSHVLVRTDPRLVPSAAPVWLPSRSCILTVCSKANQTSVFSNV